VETLALPLRIGDNGRFVRTDRVSSLLSVVRAMAASPASSWRHAPWFGLQEVFAAASSDRGEQQSAVEDALNRALAGLGINWARVESVTMPRGQAPGERSFTLALAFADGSVIHREVAL
jgi:hypothetical protein